MNDLDDKEIEVIIRLKRQNKGEDFRLFLRERFGLRRLEYDILETDVQMLKSIESTRDDETCPCYFHWMSKMIERLGGKLVKYVVNDFKNDGPNVGPHVGPIGNMYLRASPTDTNLEPYRLVIEDALALCILQRIPVYVLESVFDEHGKLPIEGKEVEDGVIQILTNEGFAPHLIVPEK